MKSRHPSDSYCLRSAEVICRTGIFLETPAGCDTAIVLAAIALS
jgi:hypothetical protein